MNRPACRIGFCLLLVIVPLLYGSPGCQSSRPASALFEQVWSDFDQTYSYFTYKNIDWDAVKDQYRAEFEQDMTGDEFAVKINEMLQVLHDWHVYVQKPGGEWLGYNGSYETNYPEKLSFQYTQSGEFQELGNGVIYHAWLQDNIAYIDVETLDTDAFKAVSDQDIESMFETYASAEGMIIDIRANGGGNEANAVKIASRFTDESLKYGYVTIRSGSGHDDFDDPIDKVLEPSTGTHFEGNAVCLTGQRVMSSGEWFTLMMKVCPNVTLIGDTTRGASGNPKDFSLSNGVIYTVPTWVAYTADGQIIEDNGIAPDVAISAGQSYDDSHDYVLEYAIAHLTGGSPPSLPTSTTTSVPAGTATTTTTTAAATTTVPSDGSPVIDEVTVQYITNDYSAPEPYYAIYCQAHDTDGGWVLFWYWDWTGDQIADHTSMDGFLLVSESLLEKGQYTWYVQVMDDEDNLSEIEPFSFTVQ